MADNSSNGKIKIAFQDEYILRLPKDHKFPISKYRLIPETLMNEGTITEHNIFAPGKGNRDIVELTHTNEYVSRLVNNQITDREIRRIGFPYSKELVEREFIIAEGTVQGALHAMESGVAFNVAGGTHHAYANRGEGFCIFNDVAVAANYLRNKKIVKKILVVDLDVHQGNGTAVLFQGNNDVYTFSMHGVSNYPLKKEESDLDVPLKDGTDDDGYLFLLKQILPKLIKEVKPEFIFYIAGADVLSTDKWGRLALTHEGAKRRDKFVFREAKKQGIPVFVSMGGGYSPNIEHIVEAHCNTYRLAFEIYQ